MPISGLILTFSSDTQAAQAAILRCHEDPRIEVGEFVGLRRCPVTLTTDDQAMDKAYWQRLQEDPGIDFVDVVCVFFDEDQADDSTVHEPGATHRFMSHAV